ncbi:MAG: hypothetical protein ACE5FG_14500 [Myxococcota bacterium]
MPREIRCGGVLAALLLLACGSGSTPAPAGESAKAESSPVSAKVPRSSEADAARETPAGPRPFPEIWAEMVRRRAEIDRLFEQERLLEIVDVTTRMIALLSEIQQRSRELDELRQVQVYRLMNGTKFVVAFAQEAAQAQIPGALRFRLWEMDNALVDVEEDLAAELGDAPPRYPRPASRPPV